MFMMKSQNIDIETLMNDLECCINKHHENCCQLGNWHEEWNCMTHLMKRSLALIKAQIVLIELLRNERDHLKARLKEELDLKDDLIGGGP